MKFLYLVIASAYLTLTLAGPVNTPRQGVSNVQLSCNGTSGAECNRVWWTSCSSEGNIIMAAPRGWNAGDCTDLHCNCTDIAAPKPKPTADGSTTTTATFTRETDDPSPKTSTISPGTTPIPGSFIWK